MKLLGMKLLGMKLLGMKLLGMKLLGMKLLGMKLLVSKHFCKCLYLYIKLCAFVKLNKRNNYRYQLNCEIKIPTSN